MTVQTFFMDMVQGIAATAVPGASSVALEYHVASNGFWAADKAVGLALPALLLLTGLGARSYARISRRFGDRKWLAIAAFAAMYFALDRSLRAIVGYFWDAAYSRASQGPLPAMPEWALGKFGETVPVVLAMTVAVVIGYALLSSALFARSPRRAWIGFGAMASLLFVGALLAEPYTQDYLPLGTSPVEMRLAEAGATVGIPRDRIVLQTCEPAAACPPGRVIGVGPTRLMLMNASLLHTDPPDWTLQVFAHEAKHFVKDDNIKAMLLLVFLSFLFAWSIYCSSAAISERWGGRFGIAGLSQPPSLPLIVLLFGLIQLVILPPVNAFRQWVELEADRFALEMTRQNAVQGAMLAEHAHGGLVVPESSAFAMRFRNSHPSVAERIRLSNDYRPWAEGKPLRYADDVPKRNDD
ncbi:MAG: M48 family metalloprotease [Myxococcaceae bacterium]